MAKQAKKPTCADKKVAAQAAELAQEVKVKGSKPDFQPNQNHLLARKQQEEAEQAKARTEDQNKRIKEHEARLSDIVKGIPGVYHVFGRTSDGHFSTKTFVVTQRWFPAHDDKPGHDALIIQEPFFRDGPREKIFVPHAWLFKKYHKVKFTLGKIGAVQDGMLTFLQNALNRQIAVQEATITQERFIKMSAMSVVEPMTGIDMSLMYDDETPDPMTGIDMSSMSHVDADHRDKALA